MSRKVVFKKEVMFPDTGEIVEAIAVIPEKRDKDFAKIFRLFSEKVLNDLGLINGEAKLLLWFLAKTVEQNIQGNMWIVIDHNKVAKELGIGRTSLYNYLSRLKKLGYLEQAKPKNSIYRLKPDFVYKGVLKKFKEDEIDF